jgi:hypothetical protein
MVGEIQNESNGPSKEVPFTAARESELRLKRLDLAHERRIRLKIANEMMDLAKIIKVKMEEIDDELAGQRSFFD